jgi:diguanylate cyclase (GGDEF)-like protein
MGLKLSNKSRFYTGNYARLIILFCFVSLSATANELWTRYQFTNLEVPLPSIVNTILEDGLGQIWVGSESGLYRIHNNKIQKVSHAPKSTIEHIFQTDSDDIWMATSNGVWRWQSQTNNFNLLSCTQESSFSQLIDHPSLGLIALARSGLYQFSKAKDCAKIVFGGLGEDLPVERIAQFQQKLLLAVRGRGLLVCTQGCKELKSFSADLSNTRVREIVANKNILYVGTHKHGFYALNDQGEVLNHWHKNAENESHSLPVNGVMTLLPTEKSIWAGLWAGGLQEFETESGRKLSNSSFYAPDITTLGGRHVFALLKSKNGNLYIGHENGISIILPAFNQQGWIGLVNDSLIGFSNDNVFSFYPTSQAWFTGTSSSGLYRIGPTGNQFLRMASDSDSPYNIPTNSVWHIIESNSGDLLLGTSNGVIRLNPNSLEWQVFGDSSQLKSVDVYSLTEAPDQTLWLSLWEGGIARLDTQGQLIGQWSQQDGLQNNTSMLITSNSDNEIFVLNNAGLFRYDKLKDKFVSSELQNKQNNCAEIEHVSKDANGQLWALCQHKSLWSLKQGNWVNYKLPTSDPIIHLFTSFDHLQTNNQQLLLVSEKHIYGLDNKAQLIWKQPRLPMTDNVYIRQMAVVKNELISATNKGLYRQKLSQNYHETAVNAPIITGIRLFNKPWKITDEINTLNDSNALFQGQLQLSYDQDLITFEFAMPGFHHQPIQGFNYRLVPFDNKWLTTAEDEAKASYTRLPPGEYRFEAKAVTSKDLPAATFQLEILPPWYLTWWAKTLAVITLVAAVLGVIFARTRRLKQSNIWLQESVDKRTAELQQANKKLQQAANVDVLTGLLNRRGFLNLCYPNWKQWQGKAMLMIADIDHFKQVNDQYGHQIGDDVLVTCAQRLKEQADKNDLIARWGGEEFLILLRDDSVFSIDKLLLRANRLQQIIGKTAMQLDSVKITVTVTAGLCDHQGQEFDTCLQQADQKLYQGKNLGRNCLIQ